jgi:hypothetical protein
MLQRLSLGSFSFRQQVLPVRFAAHGSTLASTDAVPAERGGNDRVERPAATSRKRAQPR